MKEPENIVHFKEMAGRILGTLYAGHPQDAWNRPSLVFGDDEPGDNDAELYENSVNYLLENGYLTRTDPGFVRLNDRSFHVLGEANPLEPKKSIGASLADWAGKATSETGKTLLAQSAGAALVAL